MRDVVALVIGGSRGIGGIADINGYRPIPLTAADFAKG